MGGAKWERLNVVTEGGRSRGGGRREEGGWKSRVSGR